MPGLISSGWDLAGFSSQAATVEVGAAVGGGRFSLDIKDPSNSRRKLSYVGVSGGLGLGADVGGAARFILNYVTPLVSGALNSLESPSTSSRIFLKEVVSTPRPLSWGGDFLGKSILMVSAAAGIGTGVGGTIICFFPSRVSLGQVSPIIAIMEMRAVAFSAGMQNLQVGAEALLTAAFQT